MRSERYVTLHQMPASQASAMTARTYWVVRTRADPRPLETAVRNAVHEVDPDVATSTIRTLDDVLLLSLAARRMNVRLLEAFGPGGHRARGVLFAIGPSDPITYVAVAAGLLAVSIVASYLPARRAGIVDPVELLKA